ncbi:hypothetical protein [Acinetobacter baumannii]|uniref:hypothetical protein n=1 Tax=Acinetobacter baumannii TaxID=470 RepID=UPI000297A439|nr:hypothetical protein ACIN5087_2358 [Acinetobacter baumannii OIFC087]
MSNDPIICEICGGKTHVIAKHLKEKHPETTYEEYKKQYPDSPLLSPLAQKKMQEQAELKRAKEAELAKAQQEKATDTSTSKEETTVSTNNHNVKLALTNNEAKPNDIVVSKPFHEIFDLKGKSALSGSGKPIPISCIENSAFPEMIPEINDTYVWNVNELKDVMIALELNINPYVWGHKGAGKSEMFDQIFSRA